MKNRASINLTAGRTVKFALLAGAALSLSLPALAATRAHTPPLSVTNAPLPPGVENDIYSSPSRAPETTAADINAGMAGDNGDTAVAQKVQQLRADLGALQSRVGQLAGRLAQEERAGKQRAADYYANIATINTQLQVGTTPGNPRLVAKLDAARADLDQMSGSISNLNGLAAEIGAASTDGQYLLQATQASYGLAGGVEEDRVRLNRVEDTANSTTVAIDRMATNVNDDLSRTAAYVSNERENLRTLSLAVQTGDLFGHSLANRSFAGSATDTRPADLGTANTGMASNPPWAPSSMPPSAISSAPDHASAPAPQMAAVPDGARPLMKIRFDKPDVSYEQQLYTAVNEALSRYPNAHFNLVAVHPDSGNAAQVAIESTRARRDAERVLRSLTQMGLSLDRIDLSSTSSPDASTDEVRLFVR